MCPRSRAASCRLLRALSTSPTTCSGSGRPPPIFAGLEAGIPSAAAGAGAVLGAAGVGARHELWQRSEGGCGEAAAGGRAGSRAARRGANLSGWISCVMRMRLTAGGEGRDQAGGEAPANVARQHNGSAAVGAAVKRHASCPSSCPNLRSFFCDLGTPD